jgi:8-oxo-dGTP diphosphatase
MQDRRRTDSIPGKRTNFAFLDPLTINPPLEKVTSVAVVPFDEHDNMVAALLKRGIDLPGGHMKEEEKTFEETARRESGEEAFITLGPLHIACVIQSDFYGSDDDDLTYMIVMTGGVHSLDRIVPNEESSGRVFLSPSNFVEGYSVGDKNLMKEIVKRAAAVYRAAK